MGKDGKMFSKIPGITSWNVRYSNPTNWDAIGYIMPHFYLRVKLAEIARDAEDLWQWMEETNGDRH